MAAQPSFAALRHRGFRAYFVTSALAMMADNIEHVISYWVMFEKFHSPALGGVAVLILMCVQVETNDPWPCR